MAEVFMANTPPPRVNNTGMRETAADAVADTARNAAVGDDRHGGAPIDPEDLQAVEQLLKTPTTGDGPAEKAMEAAHQATLAERARLAWLEQTLEAHEQEMAGIDVGLLHLWCSGAGTFTTPL